LSGLCLEDLSLGLSVQASRTVSDVDITAFAAVSGDHNPVHLDQAYAATTRFGGRIAHGMLSASFISALIAAELPGPGSVYLSQSLSFKRPVRIGDTVVTTVRVAAIDMERARVTLSTACSVSGKTVLDGEAVVLAPRRGE
jgi:3-hydroxybutyryl-CoA dehydratase